MEYLFIGGVADGKRIGIKLYGGVPVEFIYHPAKRPDVRPERYYREQFAFQGGDRFFIYRCEEISFSRAVEMLIEGYQPKEKKE